MLLISVLLVELGGRTMQCVCSIDGWSLCSVRICVVPGPHAACSDLLTAATGMQYVRYVWLPHFDHTSLWREVTLVDARPLDGPGLCDAGIGAKVEL